MGYLIAVKLPVLRSQSNQGFTLLEIMLVLVLLSLTSSLVIPRLPAGSSSSDIRQQADRFAALARAANQQALLEGKTLGLDLVSDREYEFVLFGKKGWSELPATRSFRPIKLPDDIQISYTAGDSFWQPALEFEQDDNNDSPVPDNQPEIVFWNSGEVSPASIRFCLDDSEQDCQWVVLEETGDVLVKDGLNG